MSKIAFLRLQFFYNSLTNYRLYVKMSQPIIEVKSKEKEKYMSAYVKGKEKFAYGFAGVGSYMVANIVSSYVNYYLTNIIMVTPVFILVLMIMGRVLDMCTDPMMGIIVDKTNTKKGKMRPYVQIGAFFIGIVTVFMFYPVGGSLVWRSIFAVVMYVGFGLAYTFVDVPAMGMLSVATPDKEERASLSSFYVAVGSIGGLLPAAMLFVLQMFIPEKWVYFAISAIVGVLTFIAYTYLYRHSKERFSTKTEKIKISEMFKVVAKNKPMTLALLTSMLASTRYMIMVIAIYIATYVVHIPGLSSGTVLLILYAVVGAGMFGGILLTPVSYKRIGYKKTSLIFGAIGALALGASFLVGMVNIYLALPFMAIGGLGLGAYNTLPYPMVGDSLDYLEWKTGERMEGICFSLNSFVTKFNNAVGAFGVMLGLILVKFVQPSESGAIEAQSEFTTTGMFAMATLVPAIGFALSLIPMALYDYTGEKKKRILCDLDCRRNAVSGEAVKAEV